MIKISFSWDDGAVQDLKLMDLLLRLSVPSIFFIPCINPERPTITPDQIKLLSNNGFEIGAHTYSHQYLTLIPVQQAREEIINGKDFLEQLLGQKINHFCFPGGRYNEKHLSVTKQVFTSVRTADTGALVKPGEFIVRPTFHFYNRGKKSILLNSLKHLSPIFFAALKSTEAVDYFDYIYLIIEKLHRSENIYFLNIWGHSWEIDEFLLWDKLQNFVTCLIENFNNCIGSYSDLLEVKQY
jgi:peptidoglycan/xylan/chitin deacetylase (PgdA/CDA1 family)